MARTVTYADTVAVQGFLTYLQKNYSKLINPKDTFLIAAVAAWWYQEGRGSIGNNPFNIRPGMTSFMSSGVRQTKTNGQFLMFASLTKGFEAAAYLLIHASKTYGYQLAIAALKQGGNQGAVDFLAALARSSWDAARYGTTDWLDAYNPAKNHLLSVYGSITGIQLSDPNPKPKPKPSPTPSGGASSPLRDFNYNLTVRNYLDPWLAGRRYDRRHGRTVLGQAVNGTTLKR